ncbi:hypothetical protein BOO69_14165 [Sulfitobacter alexandrii]|uniref:Methyltransferase domain-containing protein n=1 Tax=Sulfitobacter alexandrii TaxID=1917485 RepID=A0A1J0WJE8_9RHOB|nr:class I SAM-dependent methyltransferase [Sulfitobacter alexandrii]APE44427.1 hypothetical protein BOO69_14165 [Sulfitobacter alexandrii]
MKESDYDFAILHPALRRLFGASDLYNYGYWRDADGGQVATLPEAAKRLVQLHVETDPGRGNTRRVLDVGCGLGACTEMFAAAYSDAEITGVNYSARQIAHAKLNHAGPRTEFHQMDATAMDFPDQTFDCIHSVEAAMHFQPRRSFFEEVLRLLVPGGRLILTDVLARRPTTFIPAVNSEASVSDYSRTLIDVGLEQVEIIDILDDTAAPFAKAMHANAMHAYGRAIEQDVSGYLLVYAVKPG